jgi:hypothetical protein
MEENKPQHEAHHTVHHTAGTTPVQHTAAHTGAGTGAGDALAIPKFDFTKLDFAGAFAKLIEICKLNKKVIEEVANDEKFNSISLVFLAIGAAAGPLFFLIFGISFGNYVLRPDTVRGVINIILSPAISAAGLFALTYVAVNLFKGQGTFGKALRVLGLTSGVSAILALGYVVPGLMSLLSLVVGIWMLVVGYVCLKEVFKMDNTNTVLSLIVTVVVLGVLTAILAQLGIGAGIRM